MYSKYKVLPSETPFRVCFDVNAWWRYESLNRLWTGSLEQTVIVHWKESGFQQYWGIDSAPAPANEKMVKRCVLGCCTHKTLFPFPKTPWLRARWLEFLHFEEGGTSESSRLCARHFSPECFTNLKQYDMGFSDFLYLIDMAIPTIYTVGPSPSVKVSSFASTESLSCTSSQFIFLAKNRLLEQDVTVSLTYRATNHSSFYNPSE